MVLIKLLRMLKEKQELRMYSIEDKAVWDGFQTDNNDRAMILQENIQIDAWDGFQTFGYEKLIKKRSKNNIDQTTREGMIVLSLNLVKSVNRKRIPD